MRLFVTCAALVALVGCGSSSNDPRQMARDLARDSIPCVTPDDCCAIFDQCKAQALLVSSNDRPTVEVLLSEASQDSCAKCVAPYVQVDCRDGRCVALKLVDDGTATTAPELASVNHCGTVALPTGWSEATSTGAGRGLGPATIISCD